MEPYDGHPSETLPGGDAHQRERPTVEGMSGIYNLDRVHGQVGGANSFIYRCILFGVSSASKPGAENVVFVVFWRYFGRLSEADRADNDFFNTLGRFRNRDRQGLNIVGRFPVLCVPLWVAFSSTRVEYYALCFARALGLVHC
jgi:hypothetical protein